MSNCTGFCLESGTGSINTATLNTYESEKDKEKKRKIRETLKLIGVPTF